MDDSAARLAQAESHHRSGNFPEAERQCRQLLAEIPSPAVYDLLGRVLLDQGRLDEGRQSFAQGMQREVGTPEQVLVAVARQEASLGLKIAQEGDMPATVLALKRATLLDPQLAQAHHNLGVAYERLGQFDDAVVSHRRALSVQPNNAKTHHSLGVVLERQGIFEEAFASYRTAIELDPNFALAHNALGVALERKGDKHAAVESFRRAIELAPNFAEAYSNLAAVLDSLDQLPEATRTLEQSLALDPSGVEAYNNLSHLLKRLGRVGEAIGCLQAALSKRPDDPQIHLNLGLAVLLTGDLDRGFREYEWRRNTREAPSPPIASRPIWDGSSLAGRTILVQCEQGAGDNIQFVRYARVLEQLGAKVWVLCRESLLSLLATAPGVDRCVTAVPPASEFDCHVAMTSLGGMFHTSLYTIPNQVPYLFPAHKLDAHWRERLGHADKLRVGIAWQGDPVNRADRFRSFPLERLSSIVRVVGVQAFSLQMGFGREQLRPAGTNTRIIDLADELGDFHNTAAAIRNLDLVITCDSAPAHLAGALGIPVWVALTHVPDWRWLLAGDRSPWYPTMRLYRQSDRENWAGVFEQIERDVTELARTARGVQDGPVYRPSLGNWRA